MSWFTICANLWIIWIVVWMLWALRTKKTQQREGGASQVFRLALLGSAIYLIFFAGNLRGWWHRSILPYHPWMGCTGMTITVLGFAITLWARFLLGSNWSNSVTIKVAHELIRTGPYRWVRHPIYSGMILAMLGTAIALDQWRGAVSVALLWVAFTFKQRKEERFMRQTFGAQYADYSKTTGAIFPSLRRHNVQPQD
jgi:protein-S-isoprenylcysteine O-methyltransferase Ste14